MSTLTLKNSYSPTFTVLPIETLISVTLPIVYHTVKPHSLGCAAFSYPSTYFATRGRTLRYTPDYAIVLRTAIPKFNDNKFESPTKMPSVTSHSWSVSKHRKPRLVSEEDFPHPHRPDVKTRQRKICLLFQPTDHNNPCHKVYIARGFFRNQFTSEASISTPSGVLIHRHASRTSSVIIFFV